MGKGNDQVAQVLAVIGLILFIIAIIYAFFAGSRRYEEGEMDILAWRLAGKRVTWLFLAAIGFFLAALVWGTLDPKKGGCCEQPHHKGGKKPYKAAAPAYEYDRPFQSNSAAA